MENKSKFQRYKYFLWLLYIPAYFISFILLEKRNDVEFHYIHSSLDDSIPFCEFFIIPYYLWFLFIFVSVGLFIIFDFEGFKKLAWFLALGMTAFIIICYFWPNALHLRPTDITRNNFCARIVKFLYKTDTSTNVFPSIHVYNTLCVETAILKSRLPKKHKGVTAFVVILSVLIIAATVFLKQHSIIDVFGAFGMAFLFYLPIYLPGDLKKMREKKAARIAENTETTESAA
ncbi:MAG TPA: phosphoesterase [Lachnospiraceae bacterium]|nr:phosphoesterase [Lachnospiraceae bacterium]